MHAAWREPGPRARQRLQRGDHGVQRQTARVYGRQPEFQLRLPGLESVEQDRLALEALQRAGQCLLQPVGETWLPAGIEATEMQPRAHQPLKLAAIVIRTEAIEIHRLQQPVQEGPRARSAREVMQMDLAHRHRQAASQQRAGLACHLAVRARQALLAFFQRDLGGAFGHAVILGIAGVFQRRRHLTGIREQGGVGGDPPVILDAAGEVTRAMEVLIALRRWLIVMTGQLRQTGHASESGRLLFTPAVQRSLDGAGLDLLVVTHAEQITDGGDGQAELLAEAALADGRQSQPAGELGTRQRHVEQTHVFHQTCMIGRRDGLLGGLLDQDAVIQRHVRRCRRRQIGLCTGYLLCIGLCLLFSQPALLEGQQAEIPVRLGGAEAGHERQQHDGILKPLGLVDGDDPYQSLITFQSLTETVAVQRFMAGLQRLMPPAQQRLLAIEALGGILGQLPQVQHIRQGTLPPGAGRQPLTDPEVTHHAAQHRQHTAPLPVAVVAIEALDLALPGQLIHRKTLDQREVIRQQACRQRGAKTTVIPRMGDSLEQLQQLEGLRRVEHRALLAQIDAADTAFGKRPTHRCGLAPVAYQHRDIAGGHAPHRRISRVHEHQSRLARRQALLALEQCLDLGAAGATHVAAMRIGAQALTVGPPQIQCTGGLFAAIRMPQHQPGARALGLDRLEGNVLTAEGCGMLGEQRIHRRHHRGAGAEVARQGEARGGDLARRQIGVDIGAAEGVDGLLGVTDHQQRAGYLVSLVAVSSVNVLLIERAIARRLRIDAPEDAVLDRVGILEFVDHRHRQFLTDLTRQTLAGLAIERRVQRVVEVIEQVREFPESQTALLADQGAGDTVTRVHGDLIQQHGVRCRYLGQQVQRREEGVTRRLAILLGALLELGLTQPAQLLAVEHVGGEIVLAAGQPGGRRRQARLQLGLLVAVAVERLAGEGLAHHVADGRLIEAFLDGAPGGLLLLTPLFGIAEQLAQVLRGLKTFTVAIQRAWRAVTQQAAQLLSQCFRAGPAPTDQGLPLASQRVEFAAPVILDATCQQRLTILQQLGAEASAGIEGMPTEHALTEAVDGEDGGVIHQARGLIEAPRRRGLEA